MKKIAIVVLLSAFIAAPAIAGNLYGALDLGQSSGSDICTGVPAGVSGCKDTGTMFRGAVGTQITPMWGSGSQLWQLWQGKRRSGYLPWLPSVRRLLG